MNRTSKKPTNADSARAARIRRKLLAWYDANQRDLPWRRTNDPYAIWISETMLQQTQVQTVIPFYHKFMKRFPTVRKLASADINIVLKHWAGLGYYSRARNLHKAARVIASAHAGSLPRDVDELQELPGVGRYTAGAVASIAFDRRAPVVDGNVARVLARLFVLEDDVRAGPGREETWRIAERLLPNRRCGDFNQAIMELGATVCTPRGNPRCDACPIGKECQAFESGRTNDLPVATRAARVKEETHVVAAIEHDGRWLVTRRPSRGLWAGLWELPSAELNGNKPPAVARRIAHAAVGIRPKLGREPLCQSRHVLTHRRITFIVYAGSVRQAPEPPPGRGVRWLPLARIVKLGVSSAMRRVIGEVAAKVGDRVPNSRKSEEERSA